MDATPRNEAVTAARATERRASGRPSRSRARPVSSRRSSASDTMPNARERPEKSIQPSPASIRSNTANWK
jgi:hypothetical protein